ncbi:MAG: AzlD domain-containing protein [Acetatifactor sp.]
MELKEFFIYLFILSGSTYLIRAVPFAALRKRIENRFVKSFLYYIPYAVLTAMTIPAIFYATDYRVSAAAGLFVSIALAMKGKSLTVVAVAACVAVFLTESVLALLVV